MKTTASKTLIQSIVRLAFVPGLLFAFSTTSLAQDTTGGTATGTGTAVGQGPNISISEDVDTSAFDTLERGTGIGGSTSTQAGASAASQSTNTGNVFGGGGGGGFGGFGGLGALFGGGGFGNTSGSNRPVIRTRLRSAIQVAPVAPRRVQVVANKRISSTPVRSGLQNTSVSMNGRTAVISGTVSSDRDKRMAQLLMRLEPGVSSVQNNVVVIPNNQ